MITDNSVTNAATTGKNYEKNADMFFGNLTISSFGVDGDNSFTLEDSMKHQTLPTPAAQALFPSKTTSKVTIIDMSRKQSIKAVPSQKKLSQQAKSGFAS